MSNVKSLTKSSTVDASIPSTATIASVTPDPKATGTAAVVFCRAFKLHPATRDRSPKGVASRIARALNSALGHESNSGTFWTGADVLALAAREGITLPQ